MKKSLGNFVGFLRKATCSAIAITIVTNLGISSVYAGDYVVVKNQYTVTHEYSIQEDGYIDLFNEYVSKTLSIDEQYDILFGVAFMESPYLRQARMEKGINMLLHPANFYAPGLFPEGRIIVGLPDIENELLIETILSVPGLSEDDIYFVEFLIDPAFLPENIPRIEDFEDWEIEALEFENVERRNIVDPTPTWGDPTPIWMGHSIFVDGFLATAGAATYIGATQFYTENHGMIWPNAPVFATGGARLGTVSRRIFHNFGDASVVNLDRSLFFMSLYMPDTGRRINNLRAWPITNRNVRAFTRRGTMHGRVLGVGSVQEGQGPQGVGFAQKIFVEGMSLISGDSGSALADGDNIIGILSFSATSGGVPIGVFSLTAQL